MFSSINNNININNNGNNANDYQQQDDTNDSDNYDYDDTDDSDSDDDGTDDSDDDGTDLFDSDAEAQRTREILDNLMLIIQRRKKFPLRQRNKIPKLAGVFLEDLENDVHEMICDQNENGDRCQGLDSDRDTEEEMETAIRFIPDSLLFF